MNVLTGSLTGKRYSGHNLRFLAEHARRLRKGTWYPCGKWFNHYLPCTGVNVDVRPRAGFHYQVTVSYADKASGNVLFASKEVALSWAARFTKNYGGVVTQEPR